jgi:outer membrane lipoprotein-sorting protein
MLIGRKLVLAAAVLVAFASPLAARAESDAAALEPVLTQMDSAAANFRNLEASFVWDRYEKVVNDTDTQKGRIFYRRQGTEIQMAADITDAAGKSHKSVLFSEGKVQMFEPVLDQVTVYNAGKNRSEIESFLVLGFGGRGHDLLKSYDLNYVGVEKIDGVDTAKLDLIPKSAKLRDTFSHILLWIDPTRGISLQQQLFEPYGNYRLAHYTEIKLNQKLPDNAFKLKTGPKTRIVSPQG